MSTWLKLNKLHAREANDSWRDDLMLTSANKGGRINYNSSHESYPQLLFFLVGQMSP
ncbi:MAG: hypothetical protein AAFQ14_13760 [Cyanobacteria bacterium J06621_12]